MLCMLMMFLCTLLLFESWVSVFISLILILLLSLLNMNSSCWFLFDNWSQSSNITDVLIMLSCLLCALAILSTPSMKTPRYLFCILLLGVCLFFAFSMSNILLFYVFFEASLIPTLLLIMGWGYQPERLQAGTYMMLYTVSASLPLLVILIWRCDFMSSMMIWELVCSGNFSNGLASLIIYGAFLVKLPMYSVHLWLPKAHVEAPLAGSMILAGILLKLGGYGIMQMNLCFCLAHSSATLYLLLSISMWGGLLSAFMCLRQVDVKALVAYSSVGHMGIVSAGFLLDSSWGVSSALITMVAHGFSSSALFCLAYFTYNKVHSRSMPYMKGFLQLYPSLSFFWFVFCCINMAAPPSINLLGELLIVPALWMGHIMLVTIMGLMVFFSAAYNMYLYSSINHGPASKYMSSGSNMRSSEKLSLVSHLMPLLILFKGSLFLV